MHIYSKLLHYKSKKRCTRAWKRNINKLKNMRQETTMTRFAAGEDYRVNKFDGLVIFDTAMIFLDFNNNHFQH